MEIRGMTDPMCVVHSCNDQSLSFFFLGNSLALQLDGLQQNVWRVSGRVKSLGQERSGSSCGDDYLDLKKKMSNV